MKLNNEQIDKLVDLLMDTAKGLLLAALAIPVISSQTSFIGSMRLLLSAFALIFISLKFLELKEVKT